MCLVMGGRLLFDNCLAIAVPISSEPATRRTNGDPRLLSHEVHIQGGQDTRRGRRFVAENPINLALLFVYAFFIDVVVD